MRHWVFVPNVITDNAADLQMSFLCCLMQRRETILIYWVFIVFQIVHEEAADPKVSPLRCLMQRCSVLPHLFAGFLCSRVSMMRWQISWYPS